MHLPSRNVGKPRASKSHLPAEATRSIAFLTVVKREEGAAGGLLVVNAAARPLEFHCTAPVRASRAQEILYGPTLEPFLFGEQIGAAMWAKVRSQPRVACTDLPAMLALRPLIKIPLVLLCGADEPPADREARSELREARSELREARSEVREARSELREARSEVREARRVWHWGAHRLACLPEHAEDAELAQQFAESFAADFDLQEPFARIREAICEAQKSAPRAA